MPYVASTPYAQGSDTSREAAVAISGRSLALRTQILDQIRALGDQGSTCDEIEIAFGMRHQTASARIRELKDRNLISDSGRRRQTRSGRSAVVYVAVSA